MTARWCYPLTARADGHYGAVECLVVEAVRRLLLDDCAREALRTAAPGVLGQLFEAMADLATQFTPPTPHPKETP